jgi:hypothetical protein
MVPANVLPACVTVHVVLPIITAVAPAPIIEPDESDAEPTQVPAIVAGAAGLVGNDVEPLQPAAVKAAAKPTTRMKPIASP